MRVVSGFGFAVFVMSALSICFLGPLGIVIAIAVLPFVLCLVLPAWLLLEFAGARRAWGYVLAALLVFLPIPLLAREWMALLVAVPLAIVGGIAYWWTAIHVPSRPAYARTHA